MKAVNSKHQTEENHPVTEVVPSRLIVDELIIFKTIRTMPIMKSDSGEAHAQAFLALTNLSGFSLQPLPRYIQ